MINETGDFSRAASQRAAVLLWQSVNQCAAVTRLQLLERIKSQPSELDHEFSNIRASINWLAKQQDRHTDELLIHYVEALESYLRLRGRGDELVNWCMTGLEACERLRRNPARILLILGNAQFALGEWEGADTSWQAAMDISRAKDPFVFAHATAALGRLQTNQGKYKLAMQTLSQAEDLLLQINDAQAVIGVRSEIAAYYLDRRELDRALNLYLEIDEFYKKNVSQQSSNHMLLMLGVVYRQKRIFDKAIEFLSELCLRGEAQKDTSSLATATHHLAWVYFERRKLEKARYLCGKALALYDDLHDIRGLSDGYEQLGAISLEEGNLSEAITFLEESIRIRQQIGNRPGSISSLRRLAFAHLLEGNRKGAMKLVFQVLRRYLQLGTLSRQRTLYLLRDFLVGFSRAIAGRMGNKKPTDHSYMNEPESVMESFSRTLVQPKNDHE